nr:transposase [Actinomycetota bacterium]
MGHTKLSTTQGYYKVTDKRKRKAVDQLAALQLDRNGERARRAVERLLESEALRDAVGQVAVPFGICREPTNVKAQGQA